MSKIKYFFIEIIALFTRFLPLPVRTGIIKIGNPGPEAPVLLTGNYALTVERVKRAVQGQDVFLLVANSKGINIWCAATGGHFTNHHVISALKTSGIEKMVTHREVILPQLAATGIEGKVIREKTGWIIRWGPVDAKYIPQYLKTNKKTKEMRTTSFPLAKRVEMATVLWIPLGALVIIVFAFLDYSLVIAGLTFSLSLVEAIFIMFPLYQTRLRQYQKDAHVTWISKHSKIGIGILFFSFSSATLTILAYFTNGFSREFWFFEIMTGLIIIIVFYDLGGMTPVFKSDTNPEREFFIKINPEKCRGFGYCETVCPRDCFQVDVGKIATIPRATQCVQCGACIVQCPFNALFLENHKGERLLPKIIRRYKLNMMGKRTVSIE